MPRRFWRAVAGRERIRAKRSRSCYLSAAFAIREITTRATVRLTSHSQRRFLSRDVQSGGVMWCKSKKEKIVRALEINSTLAAGVNRHLQSKRSQSSKHVNQDGRIIFGSDVNLHRHRLKTITFLLGLKLTSVAMRESHRRSCRNR